MQLSELKSTFQLSTEVYSELPAHVAGFCAFMINGDRAYLKKLVQDHEKPEDGNMSYPMVACIGYALASGLASEELLNCFRENVDHLSGRTFFADGRVPRFEIDGLALLGVALGFSSFEATECEPRWFIDLLEKSAAAISSEDWEHSLIKGAQLVLGQVDPNDIPSISFRVALQAALGGDIEQNNRQLAWEEILSQIEETSPAKIAVNRSVFECCVTALSRLPVHGAGIAELISLLENLSNSISHWTYETKPRVKNVTPKQWEIDHEYHVQNLLWTVLRPVFSDLVDEQSLPKLGHSTPRYDLGVPSLQAIVEVKFMRRSGPAECRKITQEIAADRSLYLGGRTGYTKLVVFIWDDCCQTEEYRTLKDGLESLNGIEKVIILPRPSRMDRAKRP